MSDISNEPQMEFGNKCFVGSVDDRTERVLQPHRPESGIRIHKMAVFGIFVCLFLVIGGLGANIYFITNIMDRVCVTDRRTTVKHNDTPLASASTNHHTELDKSATGNLNHSSAAGIGHLEAQLSEIESVCDSLKEKFEQSTKYLENIQNALSQQEHNSDQTLDTITRMVIPLSRTVDVMEKKLDKVSVTVTESRRNIAELNGTIGKLDQTAFNDKRDILNQMDTLRALIIENGNRSRGKIENIIDITNETLVILRKVQNSSQMQQMNQLIVDMSGTIGKLGRGLTMIEHSIGSARNHSTELHTLMNEHVLESTNGLERAITTTREQLGSKTDTIQALSNSSLEMLNKLKANIDLSIVNIANISDHQHKNVHTLETVKTMVNMTLDICKPEQSMEQNRGESLDVMTSGLNLLNTKMTILTNSVNANLSLLGEQETTLNKLGDKIDTVVQSQQNTETMIRGSFSNISNDLSSAGGHLRDLDATLGEVSDSVSSSVNTLHSSLQLIQRSVTIQSSKVGDANLSSAVVDLVDKTSIIYAAVVNAVNQTPTCRSDGCFVKVVPIGASPSESVVQMANVKIANATISTGRIQGRLEVYVRNAWGTVCDDSFDNDDATVACRMLGYTTGVQKQAAFFGQGSGSILMDDVNCAGRETSIFSCSYTASHNCGHGEDVGIICT